MNRLTPMKKTTLLPALATLLAACGGGGGGHSSGGTIAVADHIAAALGFEIDETGASVLHLATFHTNSPSSFLTDVKVTGVDAGDALTAIDQRPSTGVLYAAGASGTLYTLVPATGVATKVGATNPLSLTNVVTDMDFDPTTDQVRVIGNFTNARLDPATGALVANETADSSSQIDSIAYSPSGTLYAYSIAVSHRARLVKIATPSTGAASSYTGTTLAFFGDVSGNNPLNEGGMDISSDGKTAILASFDAVGSTIVLADVASGAQDSVGTTPAGMSFQVVSVAFVDPTVQSNATGKR